MGISIVVNGLVGTSTGYNSSVYKAYLKFVEGLCEAMSWKEVPWQEPEGEDGFHRNMAYGKYNQLLKLALTADTSNPPYYKDDEGTTISDCKSQLFPHLLDRDIYWNIYVPFDLKKIVHGEAGYSFSVGSAVCLGQELDKLTPYIQEEFVMKVFGTKMPSDTEYYMENLIDILGALKAGVSASLRLNLPLQIRW